MAHRQYLIISPVKIQNNFYHIIVVYANELLFFIFKFDNFIGDTVPSSFCIRYSIV